MLKYTKFLKSHKTPFSALIFQDITYKLRHQHSNLDQFQQELLSTLDKLNVTHQAGSIVGIKSNMEVYLFFIFFQY